MGGREDVLSAAQRIEASSTLALPSSGTDITATSK